MEAAGRRIFLCIAIHLEERKRIKLEKQTKLFACLIAVLSKIAEDHEQQQKLDMLREYVKEMC